MPGSRRRSSGGNSKPALGRRRPVADGYDILDREGFVKEAICVRGKYVTAEWRAPEPGARVSPHTRARDAGHRLGECPTAITASASSAGVTSNLWSNRQPRNSR